MNQREIAIIRFALMYVVVNAEEAHKFITTYDGIGEISARELESEANFIRSLLDRPTIASALKIT